MLAPQAKPEEATPLAFAIARGCRRSTVAALLLAGESACARVPGCGGRTAWHLAAGHPASGVALLALVEHAKRTQDIRTVERRLGGYGDGYEEMKRWRAARVLVHKARAVADDVGRTPVHYAALDGGSARLEALLGPAVWREKCAWRRFLPCFLGPRPPGVG